MLSAEWGTEAIIRGNLSIVCSSKNQENKRTKEESVIKDFLYAYQLDYYKNHVAVDMEWNSKGQTFDRDLMAFRAFHEAGVIDLAVMINRSEELNIIFSDLGIKAKYGASTTWIGKLIPRLDARRQGGCPVLAISIKPKCFIDWSNANE